MRAFVPLLEALAFRKQRVRDYQQIPTSPSETSSGSNPSTSRQIRPSTRSWQPQSGNEGLEGVTKAGPQTHHAAVSTWEVDTGALVDEENVMLDELEALRIRKKIDRHIMPLMMILYWVQFMDKSTLGSSAILGIRESTHLTTNQFNWLGTIFYIAYFIFQYPQNLALQRFPVGKWLSLNILSWGIALMSHAACKSFFGLFIARFILGACEGSITAGFMIVSGMFYTRKEQTLRVGYWFLMNGTAQIVMGFLSFGILHVKTGGFEPWQWLMTITGFITLGTGVIYWFFFPDSPTTAWFLTADERAKAVARIRENQTGVENKHFKKEQMMEALTDSKTWLFALFALLNNIPSSILLQRQLIVSSFGFTRFQTTLLGCFDGVLEIITIWTGVQLAAHLQDARAYVGTAYMTADVLAAILVTSLPWSNKIGLLCATYLTDIGTTGFVLSLSWLSSVTAGHTKKVTTNAIILSAVALGNSIGPLMWREEYKPRNYVPWTVIGLCYFSCQLLLLAIRRTLMRENQRRDAEPCNETFDDIWVQVPDADGNTVQRRVHKEFLDLTDRRNRAFRYVL